MYCTLWKYASHAVDNKQYLEVHCEVAERNSSIPAEDLNTSSMSNASFFCKKMRKCSKSFQEKMLSRLIPQEQLEERKEIISRAVRVMEHESAADVDVAAAPLGEVHDERADEDRRLRVRHGALRWHRGGPKIHDLTVG